MLAMVLINVSAQVALMAMGGVDSVPPEELAKYPFFMITSLITMLSMPAMLWLTFSKSRWVNITLLVFIAAVQFLYAIAALGVPFVD